MDDQQPLVRASYSAFSLGAMEKRTTVEWLEVAKIATGVDTLVADKLGIFDGMLRKLNVNMVPGPLRSLPDKIVLLASLTELNISYNHLASLPEEIGHLVDLAVLNLSYNDLASLPESLQYLTKLERLDLTKNKLAVLPDNIGRLLKLTELRVDQNKLDSLPESIGKLASLKFLDLSNNNTTNSTSTTQTLTEFARQLLPQTFLCPDDNILLEYVRNATQIPNLDFSKLKLVNGVLVGLSLSNLRLPFFYLPDDIGRLTSLKELDLSLNELSHLPTNMGELESLTELHLSHNKLETLPESIVHLTKLTVLVLYNNKFNSLPDNIGNLSSLTRLSLGRNQLTSLPGTIGQLVNLTSLNLGENQLCGIELFWIGKLTQLKYLDLSGNKTLGGSLPSLDCNVEVLLGGTEISGVRIKIKPVESLFDFMFVILHVLIGYLDVLTDVLSIIQFHKQGNTNLMGANITILLFNVCVDVSLMPDKWGRLLALLQVQQTVQGFKSLYYGRQTENFVRSKKVDAVCRSVPSIVLQLYGLLATLPSVRSSEGAILVLSVVTGVIGSAISLGTLSPKSGFRLFDPLFFVHFCYYVCELTARLLSMSLLFVSIGPIAFAVLGADFLMRLLLSFIDEKGSVGTSILSAVLAFGSDGEKGISLRVMLRSSIITSVVLLISLCLVNLLDTPDLRALREASGRPVQGVTALACLALFFKYLFGVQISNIETQNSYEAVEKWVTRKEAQEKDAELQALRIRTEQLDARTEQLEARLVALEQARAQQGGALDSRV